MRKEPDLTPGSPVTIGDKYGYAMEVTTQKQADAYFKKCVLHCMSHGKTREEAEGIERSNIGYYTGYCNAATASRAMRLFRCAHPIFGKERPSPREAFEAGVTIGRRANSVKEEKRT